jgi:hypothetical protein
VILLHPLPPLWDAAPVCWSSLAGIGGSINLHIPPEPCDTCGSLAPRWHARGDVQTEPNRLGQRRWCIRFLATRCRACHTDVVHDRWSGETWVLGPEDYGPEGSHVVVASLW